VRADDAEVEPRHVRVELERPHLPSALSWIPRGSAGGERRRAPQIARGARNPIPKQGHPLRTAPRRRSARQLPLRGPTGRVAVRRRCRLPAPRPWNRRERSREIGLDDPTARRTASAHRRSRRGWGAPREREHEMSKPQAPTARARGASRPSAEPVRGTGLGRRLSRRPGP
jgi:hypothetical protein